MRAEISSTTASPAEVAACAMEHSLDSPDESTETSSSHAVSSSSCADSIASDTSSDDEGITIEVTDEQSRAQAHQMGEEFMRFKSFLSATNTFFNVLSYDVSLYGESSPKCAESYLHYTEAFLRLLQATGPCKPDAEPSSSAPEGEDHADGDGDGDGDAQDWELLLTNIHRALSGFHRRLSDAIKVVPTNSVGTNQTMVHLQKSLKCAYGLNIEILNELERFSDSVALCEECSRQFPSFRSNLLLLQAYILNEQFSSARVVLKSFQSEIKERDSKRSSENLNKSKGSLSGCRFDEDIERDLYIQKLSEFAELLIDQDPGALRWEVRKLVPKLETGNTRIDALTGKHILTFSTDTGAPTQSIATSTPADAPRESVNPPVMLSVKRKRDAV